MWTQTCLIFNLICRIPIWYELKLVFVAWLVLPQFRGAAFIYDKFVREQLRKQWSIKDVAKPSSPPSSSPSKDKDSSIKKKFVSFITPKKVSSLFHSCLIILPILLPRHFSRLITCCRSSFNRTRIGFIEFA